MSSGFGRRNSRPTKVIARVSRSEAHFRQMRNGAVIVNLLFLHVSIRTDIDDYTHFATVYGRYQRERGGSGKGNPNKIGWHFHFISAEPILWCRRFNKLVCFVVVFVCFPTLIIGRDDASKTAFWRIVQGNICDNMNSKVEICSRHYSEEQWWESCDYRKLCIRARVFQKKLPKN